MDESSDSARYLSLLERLRTRSGERGQPFDYPPATEAQIRTTEQRLGFALPPQLRLLYLEVANGGHIISHVYNEYALYGAVGGCPWVGQHQNFPPQTIDRLVSRTGWRLNTRVEQALRRYPGTWIEAEHTPDRFLLLADLDFNYGDELQIDAWTGYIYHTRPGTDMHHHLVAMGQAPYEGSETDCLTQVIFWAASLGEWMQEQMAPTYPRLRSWNSRLTMRMLQDAAEEAD